MMNNKFKYLFKNMGLMAISQFSTKFLTFFLVPLYTNILTTAEYGTYDVFATTISLLIPILTINIMDAVLRYSLDGLAHKEMVLSVGLAVYGKGLLIFLVLVGINYFANILPVLNSYIHYLILMFTLNAAYELLINFARGNDAVFDVAVAGIVSSVVAVGMNIYLLVFAGTGLDGYFCANITGTFVAIIYLIMRLSVWNYVQFSDLDQSLKKQMALYSVPMMLTSVSWWINSFSDRYVILAFCGVAANGIYSVAYKIPSILTAFQEVFNKAWVLSSVRTFDRNDTSGFFSQTYNLYNGTMTLICSILITFTRLIAHFLYGKDFYHAWKYVPFLTIAVIFGAMSGYLGGIFSAVKDTKAYAVSTISGAAINLILNFILVQLIGPMGAAIATTIAYYAIWQIRLLFAMKHIKLQIALKRDYVAYFLLVLQTFILLKYSDSILLYSILLFVTFLIFCLFYIEIINLSKSIITKFKTTH